MKLAIYGGTFDPIHHGHLIIAREALETLGPDEVIFSGSSIPLQKDHARCEWRNTIADAARRN